MKLLRQITQGVLHLIKMLFLLLIRIYQLFISPLLGANCRYIPTCSQYSKEAIIKYGPFKGGWLSLKSIARCHTWGGHGYDPVPENAYPPCLTLLSCILILLQKFVPLPSVEVRR